jgi:hypothetical protein
LAYFPISLWFYGPTVSFVCIYREGASGTE